MKKSGLEGRLNRVLMNFEKTSSNNDQKFKQSFLGLRNYLKKHTLEKKEIKALYAKYQTGKRKKAKREHAYHIGRLLVEFAHDKRNNYTDFDTEIELKKKAEQVLKDIYETMTKKGCRPDEKVRTICLETMVSIPQYNGAKYGKQNATVVLVDYLCLTIKNEKEKDGFKIRCFEALNKLYNKLKRPEKKLVRSTMEYVLDNKKQYGETELKIAKKVLKKK